MPFSPSIEQVVCCICHNGLLEIRFVDNPHATVIELIPVVVEGVLSICCVMTEAHITIMVGHSIAVIDHRFLSTLSPDNVLTHVKAFKREVHLVVNLLPVASSAEHAVILVRRLFLLESL
jgi:hypothetical protein